MGNELLPYLLIGGEVILQCRDVGLFRGGQGRGLENFFGGLLVQYHVTAPCVGKSPVVLHPYLHPEQEGFVFLSGEVEFVGFLLFQVSEVADHWVLYFSKYQKALARIAYFGTIYAFFARLQKSCNIVTSVVARFEGIVNQVVEGFYFVTSARYTALLL